MKQLFYYTALVFLFCVLLLIYGSVVSWAELGLGIRLGVFPTIILLGIVLWGFRYLRPYVRRVVLGDDDENNEERETKGPNGVHKVGDKVQLVDESSSVVTGEIGSITADGFVVYVRNKSGFPEPYFYTAEELRKREALVVTKKEAEILSEEKTSDEM